MAQGPLNEDDRHHPVWKKIEAHLQARLSLLRSKNDKPMSPEATDVLRGRIAEVKSLLALSDPAPQAEVDDYPQY